MEEKGDDRAGRTSRLESGCTKWGQHWCAPEKKKQRYRTYLLRLEGDGADNRSGRCSYGVLKATALTTVALFC